MYTTLKITHWNGTIETAHVTGLTEKPGELILFDKRDRDSGALIKDGDRPARDGFFLTTDQPTIQTVKKIEVYNPSGALIETHIGQPAPEAEAPVKGRKKAA